MGKGFNGLTPIEQVIPKWIVPRDIYVTGLNTYTHFHSVLVAVLSSDLGFKLHSVYVFPQHSPLADSNAASRHLRIDIRHVKHLLRQPTFESRIVHEQLE